MAFQSIFFDTRISDSLCKELVEDFSSLSLENSKLFSDSESDNVRKSKNAWIDSNHWICGYLWHYVNVANNKNFFYDIKSFDGDCIQYSEYDSGNHYAWHTDSGLPANLSLPITGISNLNLTQVDQNYLNQKVFVDYEMSRKLSLSFQLSDEDEYEGGELQFLDDSDKIYTAPKKKGTIVVFDSRVRHRVRKVKSGVRKSLVGWVVGPRWK